MQLNIENNSNSQIFSPHSGNQGFSGNSGVSFFGEPSNGAGEIGDALPRQEVVHVNRPGWLPPGAPQPRYPPFGTDDLGRADVLGRYQVSSNYLSGLQPDGNGIYTRVHRDQSRSHFAKSRGGVYQVGGFDGRTSTWRVLDPRSGREITTLERKNGEWTPIPRPSYPPGFRGRILRALDGAIETTRQAKAQLGRNWSHATSWVMNKLFGPQASTSQGRRSIEAGLNDTLHALEASKRRGAGNLQVGFEGGPGRPSAVAFPDGTILIGQYALRNWRDADLNELMIHEHTHTGAGARDHWYLNRNNDRLPNWGNRLSPFTFGNALNNADTLARAASILNNN